MSFTLSIKAESWRAHQRAVRDAVQAHGSLVPVIKGNGYGLGTATLAAEIPALGVGCVAVGTVFELGGSPVDGVDVIVLEPFEPRDTAAAAAWMRLGEHSARIIRTVASLPALQALAGGPGPVRIVLEAQTSMHRFGLDAGELLAALADPDVRAALANRRIVLEGLALHLPLAQPADEPARPGSSVSARASETLRWAGLWLSELADLPAGANALWVSHLDDRELAAVAAAVPELHLLPRIGTRLWLDRASLAANGTVLAVNPIANGASVGYRQRSGARDATLVVVSGGTSHGIGLSAPSAGASMRSRMVTAGTGALDAAGRALSPFTWQGKQRWFAEPPHAQVSLLWIPRGVAVPAVGDQLAAEVRYTTSRFDTVTFE